MQCDNHYAALARYANTTNYMLISPTDISKVCEWLCTATEIALDAIVRHWSERLLEMVPYHTRIPHHRVRSQRCSLGWHALPATLQCCTCDVHPYLQRHQLPTQEMDRG